MFETIKNFFQEIRIDLDFPRYERQCRQEHEQQAERIFSTKQSNDEINKLISEIESHANTIYDDLIFNKKTEKENNEKNTKDIASILFFFLRNYKEELDSLYASKDAIVQEKSNLYEKKNKVKKSLSEAFDEKNSAYGQLNYYKNQINSWYAKSDRTPWLFGNSGKKLPKHALFGQSFGDLDFYKSLRDSAYDHVERVKREIEYLKQEQNKINYDIDRVKNDIGEIFNKINYTKRDRYRMHELRNDGYNKKRLQSKLDWLSSENNKLNLEIIALESNKSEYINSEKHKRGVLDLEAKVREIKQKKKKFIESFELEELKQERKRSHREIWFKQ